MPNMLTHQFDQCARGRLYRIRMGVVPFPGHSYTTTAMFDRRKVAY